LLRERPDDHGTGSVRELLEFFEMFVNLVPRGRALSRRTDE
jgi:hypothetical protein